MLDYKALDWKLISAVMLLSLMGILYVMSAQHYAESVYAQHYYLRQMIWLAIAFVIFAVIVHVPLRLLDLAAYLLYGISLGLLILVLMIGSSKMGEARRFFTFGPISLAPSDIAKICCLLALSRFFAYTKLPVTSRRRLAASAILAVVPAMLVLKQPDLGTSLVFFVLLFGLWFWSGLTLGYLFLILSPLLSLIAASHWISWAAYFAVLLVMLGFIRPGMLMGITTVVMNLAFGIVTPFFWGNLQEYQKLRILTFLDPGRDPRGAGYQIIQSKIAIGSGGLTGKGLLGGSQSRLEFLPERHTDFIFSLQAEEFGLIGSLIILFLFGFIFYRAIKVAVRCRSRFASNLVMGAAVILLFQVVTNVGMTLGIMPVTGLALPFLSYGGTALVFAWTLVGLIVSADYRWQEY